MTEGINSMLEVVQKLASIAAALDSRRVTSSKCGRATT